MSAFDKVVAEWLNGVGETLPPATKQDILTGIKENIERYKAMDDTICTTPAAATGAADDDKQGEASAAEQDSRVANVSDEQQQQSAPCATAEPTAAAAVSADSNCDESATSANEVGRVLDGITHDTLHETAEEKAADDAIPPAAAATDAAAAAAAAEAAQAADDAAQDNSADVAAAGDVCARDESNDDNNKDDNEDAAAAAAAADDDHCHPHAHAAHHHVDPHADKEATTPTHEATTTAATAAAAAPQGTAAHTRNAAAATTSSATRRTAQTSQQSPPHHLPSLFTIDTSNIDYAFEESVEVALRRLEAGKTTAPLFGPEPDEDAAAACAAPPAAPRDADDTETTTAAHSGTQHEEEGDVDDNNIHQQPQQQEHEAQASRSHSGSRRASHHHDDEEAVTLSATADDSTCAKVAAMQGFVFGRASDEAHVEGAQLHRAEHDAPSSSSAAADADVAHPDPDQHTRGSADVIDETEDERRRRAQLEHSNPRIGVSDEPLNIARALATHFPTSPKSQEHLVVLTRALEHHFLFSSLDDDDIARCAAIMPVREYAAGTAVLTRGSANDVLHLILEGTAEATVPRSSSSSSSGHLEQQQGEAHDDDAAAVAVSPTHETLQLSRGNTFGDLGVLYECVNDMDVRATTPLRCATIDRTTYKLFVSRAAEERRTRYAALLQRVPFLSALPQHDLLRVAEALKEACYAQGDKIIEHGSTNQWLHLVVEGSVDVVGRDDAGAPTHIATLHAGDHAGHLECLYHHVAVADVVAATPRVRTAKLSRRQFDRLIDHSSRGPLQRDVEEDGSYAYYRATMHSASRPREDTSPAFDEPPCYLARALHDHEERAHSLEAHQPQSQVASDAAHDVATVRGDDVDEAVVAAAAEAAEAAVAAAQDERDVACRNEL